MSSRPIARKAQTGEAGNRGQFGSAPRGEPDLDLTAISDEELSASIDDMDLEDDMDFDLDGDGTPDGDLDIIREGGIIRLEGTVTQNGVSRRISEEIGEVSSMAELRTQLIAAAQRIAIGQEAA